MCCDFLQMDIDVNEYVDTFQTSLIDMTYAWCRGAKFAEVRETRGWNRCFAVSRRVCSR